MSIKFQGAAAVLGQSAAASYTGNPILIDMINAISFDFDWTGTFSGSFIIEVTNALQSSASQFPAVVDPTAIWKPILTMVVTNGSATDSTPTWWAEATTSARFIRFRFNNTSGTGLFNCKFHGKSFG